MARHQDDQSRARDTSGDPTAGATPDVSPEPNTSTRSGDTTSGNVTDPTKGSGVAERTAGEPPAMNQRTRIGAAWVAVAVAVIVLVLLLIFILQNQQQVDVTFLGATGHLPLGVLVLLAAAGGALLVIVLGAARMIQLRWLARRDLRQHKPKGRKSR